MEIIHGKCGGTTYRLSLSSKRLTQLKNFRYVGEPLFVLLRELKIVEPGQKAFWARLRSKGFPGDFNSRYATDRWAKATLYEQKRSIGCTTFNKTDWRKIERAIAEAK